MKMQQRGLTLIEMVIAISLLAIMISAIVFSFDGSKSRAQVLVAAMEEYAGAMERLKTDASCYPKSIVALMDRGEVVGADKSFCNADLSKQWNGPYVKAAATTTTVGTGGGNGGDGLAPYIQLGQISPELTLRVGRVSSNYGGTGGPATWKWFIVADGVPSEIVTQALVACNGRDAELDSGAAANAAASVLKCVKNGSSTKYAFDELGLGATDGGAGSFAMLFAETRK